MFAGVGAGGDAGEVTASWGVYGGGGDFSILGMGEECVGVSL